jgi:hypothetical protein
MLPAIVVAAATLLWCAHGMPPMHPNRQRMDAGASLPPHDIADSLHPFLDLFQRSLPFRMQQSKDQGVKWEYENPSFMQLKPDGFPLAVTVHPSHPTTVRAASADVFLPLDAPPPYNTSAGPIIPSAIKPPYRIGDTLVLLWQGVGEVRLTGDAVLNSSATAAASSLFHRATATVQSVSSGLSVRVVQASGGGITALHLLAAADEASFLQGAVFRPHVLALLREFDILRFASWAGHYVRAPGIPTLAATSFSADRALTTSASQGDASRGVAMEYIVDLCRLSRASCWINTPEKASAAYLTDMTHWLVAQLLRNDSHATAMGWPTIGAITSLPRTLALNDSRISPETSKPLVYLELSNDLGYDQAQVQPMRLLVDTVEAALASAEAQLAIPQGSLRVRVRFVLAATNYYYLPHLKNIHSAAGTLPRVDVVAVMGGLGFHAPFTNAWLAPKFDAVTAGLTWTEARVHQDLRHAALVEELLWNRAVSAVHSWGVQRTGPPLRAPAMIGAPMGTAAHEVVMYEGGVFIHAAQFAIRDKVTVMLRSSNATVQQQARQLLPQAMAELAFERLLVRAQGNSSNLQDGSNAVENILLDSIHRVERSGFTSYVAGPLMRHVQLGYGVIESSRYLSSREAGDRALAREWPSVAPSVQALEQASPKLRALLAYRRGHASSSLPFTQPAGASDGGAQEAASSDCRGDGSGPCVWGTCHKKQCGCFAGATGERCETLVPPGPATSQPSFGLCASPLVGMNVGGIADWSTQHPFVDVGREARDFISQCTDNSCGVWSDGRPLNISAGGDLLLLLHTQSAGTMMLRDLQGHYPRGTYVVLYKGDGVIDLSMDDVKSVYRTPGRILVELVPTTGLNNGLFLRIERTNPADPVRDIHVVPLHAEGTFRAFPWTPRFLKRLGSFSTIRSMDLVRTNDNYQKHWADRVLPTDRSFSHKGLAIEWLVHLANTVGSNLWLNMPHAAADDYIRRYAELVRDQLRPDLHIVIELSNEVWGTLFPGGQYAREQGVLRHLDSLSTLSSGSDEAAFCWYGLRSREMMRIWRGVWGEARSHRLKLVISSQAVNPDVSRRMLACNGTGFEADALAIAPYFGSQQALVKVGADENDAHNELSTKKMINTTLP